MAKRILLDTHVILNLATHGGLEAMPARVQRVLQDPDVDLLLSVVSEAEIAIKNRIGKLALEKPELAAICTGASISAYPLRQRHTEVLFELPLHHKDPFDRLIISTALGDDLSVISCDKEFRKYKGLRVIW